MTVSQAPFLKWRGFDNNSLPVPGGKLFTYAAGTTNKLASYTNSGGGTPNANPVILDSRSECDLFFTSNLLYKLVLAPANDTDPPTNPFWTEDNVAGIQGSNAAPQILSGSTGASYIGGGEQVVSSISGLRALLKTSASTNAIVTGYYAAGDGGGGNYWYNSADTTTADNGGTIIVANDGGRWYLSYTGVISVKQFGAKGDGSTNDTAAFLACIAYFQLNQNFRGTTIRVPSGHYILSSTLAFTAYASGLVHNMFLVGDGPDNTVLDFSGTTSSANGITFNPGAHFGVSDLTIMNASGANLVINPGSLGTTNYCNFFKIHNVRFQSAGSSNFECFNCYAGSVTNCWSFGAAQDGYIFGGYSTSMTVSSCDADSNGFAGWLINGITYSTFSACGSDSNSAHGYYMSNMCGVTFNSCGCESNQNTGFQLISSTASVTGIPSIVQDIHGVVFNGCVGLNNSASGAGIYATFIGASSSNSRPIEFIINGGLASPNTASDFALQLNGASGLVTCNKNLFDDYQFTAADSLIGSYEVKNFTVTGRRLLASLSGNQSLANATLSTITFATTTANDLGGTLASGVITIPRGVNKVRVSANLDFAANATGQRDLFLQRNGNNQLGLSAATMQAPSAGDAILALCSAVISVSAGDTFNIQAIQDSGGSLNAVQGSASWLCVEAIC